MLVIPGYCFQVSSKSQFIFITKIYDNALEVDVKLLDPILLKVQTGEIAIAYPLSKIYVSTIPETHFPSTILDYWTILSVVKFVCECRLMKNLIKKHIDNVKCILVKSIGILYRAGHILRTTN